jgi:hypothetical protein
LLGLCKSLIRYTPRKPMGAHISWKLNHYESAVHPALFQTRATIPAASYHSISDIQMADSWLFVSTVASKTWMPISNTLSLFVNSVPLALLRWQLHHVPSISASRPYLNRELSQSFQNFP